MPDWTIVIGLAAVAVSIVGLWISVVRGNRKENKEDCTTCRTTNRLSHNELHTRIDEVKDEYAREKYVDTQVRQLTETFGQRITDTVQPLKDDVNRILDILTGSK